MNAINSLPVLPLPNVVFYPHTVVPMLIVEPSYIRMVRYCLDKDLSLVIAMAEPLNDEVGPIRYSPQPIGTKGRVILLEEKEDGSLKILVKGQERVQLLNVDQNIPFLMYQTQSLPDIRDPYPIQFETPEIERLKGILSSWVEDSIPDSLERQSFYESLDSLHHIIDYLSMFMINDRHMRQILLENRSLQARVQVLSSLLKGEYPECEDSFVLDAFKEFKYGMLEQKYIH